MTVFSGNNKELLYVLRKSAYGYAQGSHMAWFNKIAFAFFPRQCDLSKLVLVCTATARSVHMISYYA